jgi:hypothetical protein
MSRGSPAARRRALSRGAALAALFFGAGTGSVGAALHPSTLAAQESVFGELGFGLPEDGLSVRSRGMGNASTALPGIQFTFRNPAALAVFDRTGISIASLLLTRQAEDAVAESRQNSAEVPFIQLAFPLGHDFVLGGGYYRYLDFDGFVDTATPFQGDSLPLRLTTEGGISVLSGQLARWLSPALRVGVGADYYTGSRERSRRIEFDPTQAVSTSDSTAHSFDGVGFSLGVQASPVGNLLLGASYRSAVTLGGELGVGPGVELDGDGDDDGGGEDSAGEGAARSEIEVELPASLYAGASYRLSRLMLAGEVEISRWSDFAVDGQTDPAFEDVLGIGLGAEYSFPSRALFLPAGTVLRAGARTRTLPKRFGGEEVRERAVSVGLGQVVGIGASNLDLSLEAGKRGSLGDNGIQESFFRLGIALSAFEKWATPTPETEPE